MAKKNGGDKQEHGSKSDEGSILINFVLDRSGSMSSVYEATIDGFNQFLDDQREQPGEAYLTLTMFDDTYTPVFAGMPLREVTPMTPADYQLGGSTALYDSIARSIRDTDELLASSDTRPDQILFVIMTDGLENASREFTRTQVFDLINQRKQDGYEFVYLGANQDAYAAGEAVGVHMSHARTWDADDMGQRKNMALLSSQVTHYRAAKRAHASDWQGDQDAPDLKIAPKGYRGKGAGQR